MGFQIIFANINNLKILSPEISILQNDIGKRSLSTLHTHKYSIFSVKGYLPITINQIKSIASQLWIIATNK